MIGDSFSIALGVASNGLEKTIRIKSTVPPGTYETSIGTSPPTKSLTLH